MCFHSKQTKKAQEVENRFNAKVEDGLIFNPTEHYNAFTFPKTPVIIDTDPTSIKHFNWGLIPKWAKDNSIRQYNINSRIETIREKASFKASVNKRCLVIANGFYEWKWLDKGGKNKQKHLIGIADDELYAYGGIYSEWVDQNTGEVINSYSIVTTEANPLVAEIHKKKRMPIILNPADENDWLCGKEIIDFALPYSANLVATNLDNTLTLF